MERLQPIPVKEGRNNGDQESQQQGLELPVSHAARTYKLAVKVNSGFQLSGSLGETTGEAGTGGANS